MAQPRNRPTVNLTLDADVLDATRAVLERIPGRMSLSQLVDELLRDFVLNMGPLIDELEATTDPVERLRALDAMFGKQVRDLSTTFTEAVRTAPEVKKGR